MEFLVFAAPNARLSEEEVKEIIERCGEELEDEVTELVETAAEIAAPKTLYGVLPIDARDEKGVTIGGIYIKSELMSRNFFPVSRVFPYISTCGVELEEWSKSLDDPLLEYVADAIKQHYLRLAMSEFNKFIRERYGISGYMPAMNPGSIKEWPLTGQRELFSIFGYELIKEKIGVTLTDSCLMLPSKTVDGIYFESDHDYENCELCPIKDCPNRRKAQMI
ncbi:MAG: vitamin B12 dependent methionine synthase [Clostridia bacterium]|nr:vitamin B12 dependent methionine synthase [Clostridia bacterium]